LQRAPTQGRTPAHLTDPGLEPADFLGLDGPENVRAVGEPPDHIVPRPLIAGPHPVDGGIKGSVRR